MAVGTCTVARYPAAGDQALGTHEGANDRGLVPFSEQES